MQWCFVMLKDGKPVEVFGPYNSERMADRDAAYRNYGAMRGKDYEVVPMNA